MDRINLLLANQVPSGICQESPGYDCPVCKDIGWIETEQGMVKCQCQIAKQTARLLERSGLENVIDRYSFANYIAGDQWQKSIKHTAATYATDPSEKWFFIGGQVGCGKTMICTAIVGELIKRGVPCLYMLWRDEVVKLKAVVTEDAEYQSQIKRYKQVECLYIDDFFKTERGRYPTAADINIAFELLNYRYNKQLPTIISSEKLLNELLDIDEATGSRIYQLTKHFCLEVPPDRQKNMRLR